MLCGVGWVEWILLVAMFLLVGFGCWWFCYCAGLWFLVFGGFGGFVLFVVWAWCLGFGFLWVGGDFAF